MTSMRVHTPKLICSTGVSNFQTFKLVYCMYNKLCFHSAVLRKASESLTSSYPRSNPLKSNRSVLNVNNGEPLNAKLTLKESSLWTNFEG